MILVLKQDAKQADVEKLVQTIQDLGFVAQRINSEKKGARRR
jgi:hypothetical protein